MEIKIINVEGKEVGKENLPTQFNEPYRPDLIKRAVLSLLSGSRQRYGSDPEAGMKHASEVSKRRREYRGCYGFGISRVNRKVMSRRGTRMNWVGDFSPQTVGGRRAHPPKAEKILEEKINNKERRKAIRSAMAATFNKEIVLNRGYELPTEFPFIINEDFENIQTTKEAQVILEKLGFKGILEKTAIKKVRAGKGKMRNRKYQKKRGILVVVEKECPIMKSLNNIPGVDVVEANALNAHLLAPGNLPGRLTLWTKNAIKRIRDENLYKI
jgi:large subunit ribosomal protein L4e